jgi:cytochrome d ubiquinol oxidase subunit II
MTFLQVTWFLLIGVLLTVFAILDGFDLGVGFWHLRARGDRERRTLLNAVGPFWDGNEVWLLTGGGAIFAAFPPVYASVLSGFYLAMILVVLAFVGRAVSLQFRSKEDSPAWRGLWDIAFSVSSVVVGLLLGVALGNIIRGIPLDAAGNYTGTFLGLLNPYALMIGVLGLVMLAFHGANFIAMKTSGELEKRAKGWAFGSGAVYLVLSLVASAISILTQPHQMENYDGAPILWAIPIVTLVSIIASLLFVRQEKPGRAFIASGLSIAGMMGTAGATLFPTMVPALGRPELSLTAANSSSSQLTLSWMLALTAVGLPFVIGYTVWSYRAFRGKVSIEEAFDHS